MRWLPAAIRRRRRRVDKATLSALGVDDLTLLALLNRVRSSTAPELAAATGRRRSKTLRSLRRLRRQGLVTSRQVGPGADEYMPVDGAAELATGELMARVLDDIQPLQRAGSFAARRLKVGASDDPSPLTGPRRPTREDSLEELARLATSERSEVRLPAIRALGERRDRAASPVLVEIMERGPDATTRLAAARELAKVGDERACVALRRLAESGSSAGRHAAVRSLGILGDRDSVAVIGELMTYPNGTVRDEIAGALRRIGDPRAEQTLADGLPDEHYVVRSGARKALMELGTEGSVAALRANPRRLLPLRLLDVRRARRGIRRRARNPLGEPPRSLAPLARGGFAMMTRWVSLFLALVVLEVVVVGANPVVVLTTALVVAGGLAWVTLSEARKRGVESEWLDVARARAAPIAVAVVEPVPVTLLRGATAYWGRTGLLVAVPLLADAMIWRTGLAGALVAGLSTAFVAPTFRTVRKIQAWERVRGVDLLTETGRAPLPHRRYYVAERRG